MLGDLNGSFAGKGRRIAHSFADRGDSWPAAFAAAATNSGHLPGQTIGEGLIAGTLVATELGWQPVEDLQPGDRVVTFDSGMRPLKAVNKSVLHSAAEAAPRQVWPMQVPAGALGNRTAMALLPGQPVLIESDAAEALYGDAFPMVPAGVLEGHNGITRTPPAKECVIVALEFDEDEVVYANGMLLVHCGANRSASTLEARFGQTPHQRLTDQQARSLMKAMHHAA